MKFKTSPVGLISVEIKTDTGRKTFQLNTSDMDKAKRIASEMNLDLIESAGMRQKLSRELVRKLSGGGGRKMAELIPEWATWLASTSESENTARNMAAYGYAWAERLKHRDVDDLVEKDVDDWVNGSDAAKLNTRKFRLAVCRSVLKFATIKKYAEVNVALLVKVKHKPLSLEQKTSRSKRVFTDAEYEHIKKTILSKIDGGEETYADESWLRFWYCAIVLGRNTGLRLADIANLEKSCIQCGRLVVCTDKKNTWVEFDINDEMVYALSVARPSESDRLFHRQSLIASHPSRRCILSNRFRQVMAMCGISDHYFHELRSTRGSEVFSESGNMKDVAKALGHGDEKSSEVYVIKG